MVENAHGKMLSFQNRFKTVAERGKNIMHIGISSILDFEIFNFWDLFFIVKRI